MYHKVLINTKEWIDIVNSQKTFVPETIMEIGSLHGKDAEELSKEYHTNNVYILEAHPEFYEQIKNKYPQLKVFNIAGSNISGDIFFNGVLENDRRLGASSIHERKGMNYKKYKVKAERLDEFIKTNNILEIDLLKIDVEGHSFEVLEGFGDTLKNVKSIHIENEHIPVWENQKLYCDVEKLLIEKRFILVSIKAAWPQSDSVWIRNDLLNSSWWK